MEEENYYQDQTVFAEEEPYHLSSRKKKVDGLADVKKPSKPMLIGAAVFVVLVITLGTGMVLRSRMPQEVGPLVTVTPTPMLQSASQIDQIMLELRTAVDNADPSKTALPFPPVADQIRIDN